MAAAAMAPLVISAQAAYAQNPALSISSDTSTPVATATAVSGGPGDIKFTQGAFTIKDQTPALTLNSNNSITVTGGTIVSNNINNATAIQAQGPYTGNIAFNGGINLTESYSASDSANSDGFAEAPYAQGTGRIGIRVVGPLTSADSTVPAVYAGGTIVIQGNNSGAVSIENTVTGDVSVAAGMTITGDNSYAARTSGEITGNLDYTGTAGIKGQNAVGVQTNAPVDGALRVYGGISITGYAVTSRETGQILTNIQKTPADLQQSGPAVQIGANVGHGVFLGAPPAGTAATSTADNDGDGIPDGGEAASSLTVYGSAPVLKIGGAAPITIGNFVSANAAVNTAYGLIMEGTASAQGLFDGFTATAVDIGGAGVNLNGGIHVTSSATVTAASYQADATAFHLGAGTQALTFQNEGIVGASVTSAGTNTATGIVIDAGATVTTLNNAGSIGATMNGDKGNARAVVDAGGGITTVTNTGLIGATLTPALPGEVVTGRAIALDLSANTAGVTLTQSLASSTAAPPAITGDVLLGSGVNSVNILSGTVKGSLSMGSALGDSLTIDNGASVIGALTYSGPGMAINLANGLLQDNSPTTINATTLNVGGSSTLTVNLDPANGRSTLFNVAGAATFATGAKIGATLSSAPTLGGQTFTIVRAGALTVGGLDSSLLAGLPYMFNGSLASTATTINLTVSTKSPAQLGFNKSETQAFNAIYADLSHDSGVQTAIIGAADRPSFISAYDQLLPDSNGDVFNTALGFSKSVSRATSDRFDMSTQKDDEDEDDFIVSGFWASEFYSGMEQNKVDNTPYHSAGLGVIGGYDFGGTGVTISAGSSNITRPHAFGDSVNAVSVVEGGAYASPRFGAVSIDARLGAGWLHISNRRQFVASVVSGDTSTTSTITRTAKGDWSGYDLSAHLGAGLQLDVSKHLFFVPKVYADVFHMHENAYGERGGGAGYDFNVSARDSTQTNATASMVTGLRFGNRFVISPQLELGYDKVITGGPADTTARFAWGGPAMTVAPNHIDGAALGRLTLRGDGNYVHFSLEAGGEYSKDWHSMDLKAVFRLTF
jgi:hypothetical protein